MATSSPSERETDALEACALEIQAELLASEYVLSTGEIASIMRRYGLRGPEEHEQVFRPEEYEQVFARNRELAEMLDDYIIAEMATAVARTVRAGAAAPELNEETGYENVCGPDIDPEDYKMP